MLVDDAQHGSLSLIGNGAMVYVPEPDFFGTDTFTYQAQDAQLSNVATVTINVLPGDTDPAQAVADRYLVAETIYGFGRGLNAGSGSHFSMINSFPISGLHF